MVDIQLVYRLRSEPLSGGGGGTWAIIEGKEMKENGFQRN